MLPLIPALAATLATLADEDPSISVGFLCDYAGYSGGAKILEIDREKGRVKISAYTPREGAFKRWVDLSEISNCRAPTRPLFRNQAKAKPIVWHKLSCGDWTAGPLYKNNMARCQICRTFKDVVPTSEKGPASYYGPVGQCFCEICKKTLRNQ